MVIKEENENKSKVFFSNDYLVINELAVTYKSADIDKKLYLRNIAGTTFYDARLERFSCVATFLIGLFGLILYFQKYTIIYVLIASVLFCVGGVVGFILSRDKLTIHSNASILSISYKLGMSEPVDTIQEAIDAAVKYYQRKN